MIVVTSPGPVQNETDIINTLFDNGLKLLHVRKPHATFEQVQLLIEAINVIYHPLLVLHQYHEMSQQYLISRLHYKETHRLASSVHQLASLQQKGFVLSTSVHSWLYYNALPAVFKYAFIGPVFNSISKTGYKAMQDVNTVVKTNGISRIAIGGITKENCNHTLLNAFDGIAVLGAVWHSQNPLNEFKRIQQAWSTAGRYY